MIVRPLFALMLAAALTLGAAEPAVAPTPEVATAPPPAAMSAGAHRYQWVKDWVTLPAAVAYGGTHGCIAIDSQDRLTIFDREFHVVTQLGDNPDPKLRGGSKDKPEQWQEGAFFAPHGAAWDSKGNLYGEDWNQTRRITKRERLS